MPNAPAREGQGAECQFAGDIDVHSQIQRPSQLDSTLACYQALRLIHLYSIRPELATMLAAMAFGGGQ